MQNGEAESVASPFSEVVALRVVRGDTRQAVSEYASHGHSELVLRVAAISEASRASSKAKTGGGGTGG